MKLTKEQKDQIILQALLDVKAGNRAESDGICGSVETLFYRHCRDRRPNLSHWDIPTTQMYQQLEARWKAIRKKAFKSWKHFSGDIRYPVPAGGTTPAAKKARAEEAFDNCYDMWEGSYGKKRKALLNHVIKYVKEELKNAKS